MSVAAAVSIPINVSFAPASKTSAGIHIATLRIKSNDPLHPNYNIPIRAFAMNGLDGGNEPSLQRLMDLWQIPDKVGDDTPDESRLPLAPKSPNDEVLLPTLVAARIGPITIQMLSAFLPDGSPAARVGFYDATTEVSTELFSIDQGSNQTTHPSLSGYTRFSPGARSFGLYVNWPLYGRSSFSEDSRNSWDTGQAHGRMLRFYPLKNTDGTIVPNAYVVGAEAISLYSDQQDVMFIIRNVRGTPLPSTLPASFAKNSPSRAISDSLVDLV